MPDTDDAFTRVADALAPEFTLIASSGFAADRGQVLAMLRSEHGARPDIVLTVENATLRLVAGDIVLATYEEHGAAGGRSRATLITAVLRKNGALEHGFEWVHTHEVALPTAAQSP